MSSSCGDWRSQLSLEARCKAACKIYKTISQRAPGDDLRETLLKLAVLCEERNYYLATSLYDYARRLACRVALVEKNVPVCGFPSPPAAALPTPSLSTCDEVEDFVEAYYYCK